jgi:hypothetical protein
MSRTKNVITLDKAYRILEVGLESFFVPESVSDQKIATAINVLRQLTPYDNYNGEELRRRDVEINFLCRRPKRRPTVPLSEFAVEDDLLCKGSKGDAD